MKKLVLVLLVAMLSVPAFAANPTITLVAGPANSGQVDIKYTCDSTDANLPSGFGLTVELIGTGTPLILDVNHLDSAYTIFPGQIVINETTGVVDNYGSPIANVLDEPLTGLNTNKVVLEFGALYIRPNGTGKPAFTGTGTRLCTIRVSKSCTVRVTGNEKRCGKTSGGLVAGIIAQDYKAYVVNPADLPITIAVAPTYPACWNYLTQCNGDSNGDGAVNSTDFLALKGSYNKVKADALYNPCVDFNRDGAVNSTDFLALKNSYNKTPAATCVTGDINHIY